jgi:hypothetical protein
MAPVAVTPLPDRDIESTLAEEAVTEWLVGHSRSEL